MHGHIAMAPRRLTLAGLVLCSGTAALIALTSSPAAEKSWDGDFVLKDACAKAAKNGQTRKASRYRLRLRQLTQHYYGFHVVTCGAGATRFECEVIGIARIQRGENSLAVVTTVGGPGKACQLRIGSAGPTELVLSANGECSHFCGANGSLDGAIFTRAGR